ncbi:glycine zipper 2TM domain-containing protein [Croceibacterium ferulae]|uniref:glycine zipper 2TM domain-containing protein n=1 Tax=Croceibacterium ferulae TaxID=1854641 RepID=UPI001F4F07A4|nr:glycine zipper 2TM domain-containing protein [Croceibacterium ferulae]
MSNLLKTSILSLAASGAIFTVMPAMAAELPVARTTTFSTFETATEASAADEWNQGRRDRDRRRYGRDRNDRRYDRDRDYRPQCERKSGTTGLIVGGAAGALLGREIDGGRDRTLGTVLGAAGGALLGREIEGTGVKCR